MTLEQMRVMFSLNKMRKQWKPFSEIDLYNAARVYDRKRMIALCYDLEEKQYLSALVISKSNEILDIKLSYKGMCFFKIWIATSVRSILHWYADHILEFVAIILSVVALIKTL